MSNTKVRLEGVRDEVTIDFSNLKNQGPCKGCGQMLWWATTVNNKRMPICKDENGVWISHFKNCPKANEFSKTPTIVKSGVQSSSSSAVKGKMKISEIISQLEKAKAHSGDLEVYVGQNQSKELKLVSNVFGGNNKVIIYSD